MMIQLKNTFQEQYTMIIDSDVFGIDVHVTSKVKMRYDFQVLDIREEDIIVRLVQLDHAVIENNHGLVAEVAQVSSLFGKMFSELKLLIDKRGKVLMILNLDLILSKWEQTKRDLDTHIQSNGDLRQAIILNDQMFSDPNQLLIAVQANEFLAAYFGQHFGEKLPLEKNIQGTNIFNTVPLKWRMRTEVGGQENIKHGLPIQTVFQPYERFDKSFVKKAYSQFEGKIDLSTLLPQIAYRESRNYDEASGRLLKAVLVKEEIADERRLFFKSLYTLEADFAEVYQGNGTSDDVSETKSMYRFFE